MPHQKEQTNNEKGNLGNRGYISQKNFQDDGERKSQDNCLFGKPWKKAEVLQETVKPIVSKNNWELHDYRSQTEMTGIHKTTKWTISPLN